MVDHIQHSEPDQPARGGPAEGTGWDRAGSLGAARFVGLGLTAGVCVALGVGVGIWLDARLRTAPLFLLVGLAVGVAAAVSTVVALVRRP